MRAVPFDALGVSLALSGIPAEVLARLGGREGLFQEAVIVSHDLWDPNGGTLASHRWDIYTDTIPFLAKVLLYDSDRMISLAQGNGDTDLGSVSTLGGLRYLNISWCGHFTALGVGSLSALPALVHLDLSGCPQVSDVSLSMLSKLVTLKRLEVAMCWGITDAGLGYLSNIHALEHLNLSRRDLLSRQRLTSLSLVALSHLNKSDNITDVGVASLSSLVHLEHLDLGGLNPITDEALVYSVSKLSRLQTLDLTDCTQITDIGVDSLAGLQALRVVKLNCRRITDHSLAALSKLECLQELTLKDGGEITNDGLVSLSTCVSLRKIFVWYLPKVTDAGFASLPSHISVIRATSYC